MCGFAGFTGYLENGEEVLTNMMNKIIHRRLRWSSPPGQGEPVPRGAHPPAIPYITACFFQPADV
mgnify:CR=1 FL=1